MTRTERKVVFSPCDFAKDDILRLARIVDDTARKAKRNTEKIGIGKSTLSYLRKHASRSQSFHVREKIRERLALSTIALGNNSTVDDDDRGITN